MAQETKPVLEISQMCFQALQVQHNNVMTQALVAALKADGLNADDGWQLTPDGSTWVRMVPDGAPVAPPSADTGA